MRKGVSTEKTNELKNNEIIKALHEDLPKIYERGIYKHFPIAYWDKPKYYHHSLVEHYVVDMLNYDWENDPSVMAVALGDGRPKDAYYNNRVKSSTGSRYQPYNDSYVQAVASAIYDAVKASVDQDDEQQFAEYMGDEYRKYDTDELILRANEKINGFSKAQLYNFVVMNTYSE